MSLEREEKQRDQPGDAGDWRSRTISGAALGVTAVPDWLPASYETLREQVMHPKYPCFFGTTAERRGEMFYSFVCEKDTSTLPQTMATFTKLSLEPAYRKHNIAVFFEPDATPLTHDEYHDLFWDTLQYLHDQDADPEVASQPDPSDESWEFSFGGVQMFVVCACPSFSLRHSRNLGPGMVLLFQPRSVFVDTITNKVIGRQARNQVRERLRYWDDVPPHGDLGFYGDSGNLEWKQYFLADEDASARERCPFLSRGRQTPPPVQRHAEPPVMPYGVTHAAAPATDAGHDEANAATDDAADGIAEHGPGGHYADRQ